MTPKFHPLYHARIMAALPGHSPVEWFRSKGPIQPKEWLKWTSDINPAWDVWVESTTTKRTRLRDLTTGSTEHQAHAA